MLMQSKVWPRALSGVVMVLISACGAPVELTSPSIYGTTPQAQQPATVPLDPSAGAVQASVGDSVVSQTAETSQQATIGAPAPGVDQGQLPPGVQPGVGAPQAGFDPSMPPPGAAFGGQAPMMPPPGYGAMPPQVIGACPPPGPAVAAYGPVGACAPAVAPCPPVVLGAGAPCAGGIAEENDVAYRLVGEKIWRPKHKKHGRGFDRCD